MNNYTPMYLVPTNETPQKSIQTKTEEDAVVELDGVEWLDDRLKDVLVDGEVDDGMDGDGVDEDVDGKVDSRKMVRL